MVFMRDVISRAIIAPPNIPAERRQDLRTAFDAMAKDATFLAAAGKLGLPIEPLTGAEDEAFVDDLMSLPPAAVKRAREALAYGLGDGGNVSKPPARP